MINKFVEEVTKFKDQIKLETRKIINIRKLIEEEIKIIDEDEISELSKLFTKN